MEVVLVLSVDDELLEGVEHRHFLLVDLVLDDVADKHELIKIQTEILAFLHALEGPLDAPRCEVNLLLCLLVQAALLHLVLHLHKHLTESLFFICSLVLLELLVHLSAEETSNEALNLDHRLNNLLLHQLSLLMQLFHPVRYDLFVLTQLLFQALLFHLQFFEQVLLLLYIFDVFFDIRLSVQALSKRLATAESLFSGGVEASLNGFGKLALLGLGGGPLVIIVNVFFVLFFTIFRSLVVLSLKLLIESLI